MLMEKKMRLSDFIRKGYTKGGVKLRDIVLVHKLKQAIKELEQDLYDLVDGAKKRNLVDMIFKKIFGDDLI